MAISKEDIKKKVNTTPVVTQSVKQSIEQPQSQELQSVLKRTVQQQPVVTDNIRQQVEGTTPSTPKSAELQSIQDRTEQQMANQKVMQTPIATEQIKQAVESTRQPATTTTVSKYADMMAKLQDPTPTPEELEAERKRERRKAIFNAIGDGVSSLANLYFTTKGAPNSYNPADNMTRKQLERYEKVLDDRKKDQEQYFNQYLRLSQLDENANWRKQQTEYQKQRDNVADARYKEQQEQRAEQIKKQAEQWREEFNYRKEKDAADSKAKADAQEQQNTQFWATHNRLKEAADNKAITQNAKNRHGFPDGAGGTYSIHKDIIANQKGVIFEAIKQDLAESDDYGITAPYQKRDADGNEIPMTDAQLLQYIKMNGYKSPRAVEIMERLQYEDPNKIQDRGSKPQTQKSRGVAKWVKKEDSKDSNKIEF
jgi:hypothetical protein